MLTYRIQLLFNILHNMSRSLNNDRALLERIHTINENISIAEIINSVTYLLRIKDTLLLFSIFSEPITSSYFIF